MLKQIISKLIASEVIDYPFPHVIIDNLIEPALFKSLVRAPELQLRPARTDQDLLGVLAACGYEIVDFPGCTTSAKDYVRWHSRKNVSRYSNTACEGFGLVLRLRSAQSLVVQDLIGAISSDEFAREVVAKFAIESDGWIHDSGVQKYLDGYEISPHPDIRRKAATYMLNINTSADSHLKSHHTQILKFRPPWQYVEEYWEGNPDVDRCWIPWSWCETTTIHSANNSMILFAPSNKSLHAVKADYDHLHCQRTQVYGNIWHRSTPVRTRLRWEDLEIGKSSYVPPKHKWSIGRFFDRFSAKSATPKKSIVRDGLNQIQ